MLLPGMLATAGAQAQTTSAAGSSDLPPKAGEASTQTRGAPNAVTTNSPVSEAPVSTKDAIRQEASGQSGATTTSSVPTKAGEASTTVRGKPNANPDAPVAARSRADVRNELLMHRSNIEAGRSTRVMGGTPQ